LEYTSSKTVPGLDPQEFFGTQHLESDLGGRTARGGTIMVVSQGLKFLITIFSTVLLARLLTPSDYGLLGMVLVITGFVSLFKSLGLSAATMQRAEITTDQISTLFWINVGIGLLLMLVTALASPAVAWFYGEPNLLWITIALSVGFLLGGFGVQHEALLKRQMKFTSLALVELTSMLCGILVAVITAWYGARYWALVYNQLVVAAVYAGGIWIACRWRPGLPVFNSGIADMLRFGRNLTGHGVLNYFARNLDNILIGRFWGAAQLGLYAKAYQLLLLPIDQTTVPLDGVAVPALSRLVSSPERYRRAYLRLLEKVAMVTMPGIAFMMATSDWFVRILLGPQWMEAARIFTLLGIIGLLEPIGNTAGWLLISQKRTHHLFQWGLINGSISIASIAAGLPWGVMGVAGSYAIVGLCIRKPLLFWFLGREGPVRTADLYRAIFPSVCATVCVLAGLYALRTAWHPSSALLGLSVCLIFTLVIALLALSSLSSGRTALRDAKNTLPLILKRGSAV
jgi:O-antigen/teichoic acid export membrane protein